MTLWRGFGCPLKSVTLELFYCTHKAAIRTREPISSVWSIPGKTLLDSFASVDNVGEFWEEWTWASCSRTQDGWEGTHKDEEKLDFNTQQREREWKLHCTGYICLFVVYSVALFLFSTLFFAPFFSSFRSRTFENWL